MPVPWEKYGDKNILRMIKLDVERMVILLGEIWLVFYSIIGTYPKKTLRFSGNRIKQMRLNLPKDGIEISFAIRYFLPLGTSFHFLLIFL